MLMVFASMLLIKCAEQPLIDSVNGEIMTIHGLIPADSLGTTLVHEHVFLDWTVADSMDLSLWNDEEAMTIILPYLVEMRAKGVKSFLECTPAYLGRNPSLLRSLAQATGLQIVTNTGFYAARNQQHLPELVDRGTAQQIAEIWIKEFYQGIDETGVRPGFIKIGVDSKAELDAIDEKIVRAAAITHLATGMTIVGHTGTDTTAAQQLTILAEEGVSANAFVWTHAQNGTQQGHTRLGRSEVWMSLDGLGWLEEDSDTTISPQLELYVSFLQNLKEHQMLHQVLISHDAGWYTVGEADQSKFKPYTAIFDRFVPRLLAKGFTQKEIELLLVDNPKNAYTLRRRPI
jgi:phosphotriesterase-related protein